LIIVLVRLNFYPAGPHQRLTQQSGKREKPKAKIRTDIKKWAGFKGGCKLGSCPGVSTSKGPLQNTVKLLPKET